MSGFFPFKLISIEPESGIRVLVIREASVDFPEPLLPIIPKDLNGPIFLETLEKMLELSRNEKLIPMAKKIYESLLGKYNVEYDDSQSIGRRYRRQDEIGTPLCVTIDFETIEKDNSVTIRNRDSMEQKRININQLIQGIDDHIKSIINTFI